NTFSVGPVLEGALTYMLNQDKAIGDFASSINIVVGECNDSYLNSMRFQAVRPEHAIQAIHRAKSGCIHEGHRGPGIGMVCVRYKGAVGTCSRQATCPHLTHSVACLVLSTFGKRQEALFANFKQYKIETPDGSSMTIAATAAARFDRE